MMFQMIVVIIKVTIIIIIILICWQEGKTVVLHKNTSQIRLENKQTLPTCSLESDSVVIHIGAK